MSTFSRTILLCVIAVYGCGQAQDPGIRSDAVLEVSGENGGAPRQIRERCERAEVTIWGSTKASPSAGFAFERGVKKWPGKENDPELWESVKFTPRCAGTLLIEAEHHGGAGANSATTTRCLPGDIETFLCGNQAATSKENGASFRVTVNGKEMCRLNDGDKGPPAPGPAWNRGTPFNTYNLVCPRIGPIAVGQGSPEQTVTLWAWNQYAYVFGDDKKGLWMHVTFSPTSEE